MLKSKFKKLNSRAGFTIVELLVVVSIIGILAAVGVSLFSEPRAKSRDARRESDIKELRKGLSLYSNDYGAYPICDLVALDGSTDCLSKALRDAGAMSATPRDPRNNNGTCLTNNAFAYCYESNNNGTNYSLYYRIETSSIKPSGLPLADSPGWYVINP